MSEPQTRLDVSAGEGLSSDDVFTDASEDSIDDPTEENPFRHDGFDPAAAPIRRA